MIETTPITLNRNALISFISALIAVISICVGILPIPFAALICYPPGILFAITAIVLGLKSQRELRSRDEEGRPLAVISVWGGGLSLFAYVCMLTVGALLLPRITEYISQFIN